MGSGKTCTSIITAETLLDSPTSGINKVIVIVKGPGLIENFINELMFKCTTPGKYVPDNYDGLTDMEKTIRQKKMMETRYEFWTFETFAKSLLKECDATLQSRYNNKLFIVDEVHHLKKKFQDTDVYSVIHKLFHMIPYRKILLLSGTPMKDTSSEIANVLNLILPLEKQFPYNIDFSNYYFENTMLTHKEQFINNITGRVSVYKAHIPTVKKIMDGKIIYPMVHIPIVPLNMSAFQLEHYKQAHLLDQSVKNVWANARQAAIFVFPDGSYGSQGFAKYVKLQKSKQTLVKQFVSYELVPELANAIKTNLWKYSAKFVKILQTVQGPDNPKTFIYSEFVNGSGAILLGKTLQIFGYSQATGNEIKPGKRYALLTNQTSSGKQINKIIAKFNDIKNENGQLIQILIGSSVISEGFSIKNVDVEFILTPHWNFSDTEQVIARCWRLDSHTNRTQLTINLLACICPNIHSIDIIMYKIAEDKDFKIKQIERLLKIASIDCYGRLDNLNMKMVGYNSDTRQVLEDGSRECDYTTCKLECGGSMIDLDQSSQLLLYQEDLVERYIISIFKNTSIYNINALYLNSPVPEWALSEKLLQLLKTNYPIDVGTGNPVFLRQTDQNIYIVTSPIEPNHTLNPKSLIEKIDIRLSIEELFKTLYDEWLFVILKLVLTDAKRSEKLLFKIPKVHQYEIIKACLTAKILNLPSSRNKIVGIILKYYRGFYEYDYDENDEIVGVHLWLFYEIWKITQYVDGNWVEGDNQLFIDRRTKLYSSSVGYYGLWNPNLEEFCLRKAQTQKHIDLRKISVGRRCEDWDQPTLLDIVEHKLGLSKLALKRINKTTNRAKLCGMIKDNLFEQNLIEYTFDCGNQFKIRGRV